MIERGVENTMEEFIVRGNKSLTAIDYNPLVERCFFIRLTSMGNKSIKTACIGISCHGEYFGYAVVDLRRDMIRQFAKNIKQLYDTLNGTAILKSKGEKTHITFQAEKNGHIKISGTLASSDREENPLMLTFAEEFDQTMIKDFSERLYRIYCEKE